MVAAGDALLAPAVTRRLIDRFSRLADAGRKPRDPLVERIAELTGRETQVLALVAQGLSNVEIGTHLAVAESTVKTHVSRILDKLSLRDRTQAVVFAYESGVVAASPPYTEPPEAAAGGEPPRADTGDASQTGRRTASG